MTLQKKLFSVVAAALILLTAACTEESLDREGTLEALQAGGVMTEEQAECTLDGMIDEFGEDRLIDQEKDGPTEEETQKITEITLGCIS